MRFIYVIVAYLLTPIVCGVMLWRGLRDRGHWQDFTQRFGYGPPLSGERAIWVHAVSVGEVRAAAALVGALQRSYAGIPLVVTTVTTTGALHARCLFGSTVHVRYLPYDLPGAVHRFFERIRPRIAIILETEIWPNLYHECGRRGIPLVLASARISPKSVRRYRLLVSLFKETLSHGIVIAAQSKSDADRFRSIGANPARTHVVGNIKCDFELPADARPRGRQIRLQHAQNRPMWVAGSTHPGEEELVLQAHRRVRGVLPDALLVLVPRHPSRFDDVRAWLVRKGVSFVTRSSQAVARGDTEVLLGDTLGELISFYAASDVAFVGGSLVPIGGHNLLEPAALGVAIVTGPNTFNAEDLAGLLVENGAARVVRNAIELGDAVTTFLRNPVARDRSGAAGQLAVEGNRGALAKLLELIDPLMNIEAKQDRCDIPPVRIDAPMPELEPRRSRVAGRRPQ